MRLGSGLGAGGVLVIALSSGCQVLIGYEDAVLDDAGVGGNSCDIDGGTNGSETGTDCSSTGTGSTDGGPCTPMQSTCADANMLQVCKLDGSGHDAIYCTLGCGSMPSPHCKQVAPTGLAPISDFNAAGLNDTTLGTANILHTDTGQIEGGLRAASNDPTSLSVSSGIGFHVVSSGGNAVGVFVFGKLNVSGSPLKIVGTHPAVLLVRSDVTITAIDVSADQTMNIPGPGGFSGGTPAVPKGLGPGGGLGGNQNIFFGGGGGSGHGDHGGAGATIMNATGGLGGASYDTLTLALLRGGSGGGVSAGGTSNGGAGGGAIQIVSQTSIAIAGGIAAGGAGGRGNKDSSCGGGGAGGAILLEAPMVVIGDSGYLVTGGGGGGGLSNGNAAGNSNMENFVGLGGLCGAGHCGGQGGYSALTFGGNGTVDGQTAGCGGGGVGRIRINTLTGASTLSMDGALFVPTIASGLLSQGIVAIQ